LSYTEDFQFAQTAWDVVSPPNPLARAMDIDWDDMFQAYNRRSWKGFFCTKCGRLSCRIHWDRFECANKDCKFTIVPKTRGAFKPKDLADPHIPRFDGPATPYNIVKNEETVKLVTAKIIDDYTVRQYKLGDEGIVTHMLANLPINARECGADWLLKEYQNAHIPFLRYPMHTVQGVTRTAHYTYNVGAQYNYVTEQPTVSFEDAPEVVTKALDLIKQNVTKLYPHARFNEVLNVGYFEAQKMGVSNLTTYFIFWGSIANTRV
jgi:hypothetical protein